ncbi:MAG: methionine-rich copper-binding protein CopC [Candidatus Poriferisodalaceae bacterium]|jgi:methionine-rich copper-binding protein CopC
MRGALALIGVLFVAGAFASQASGTNQLRSSVPLAGGEAIGPMTSATLEFSELMVASQLVITVTASEPDINGKIRRAHERTVSGSIARLTFQPALEPGNYRIDWSIRAQAGTTNGSVSFDVIDLGMRAPEQMVSGLAMDNTPTDDSEVEDAADAPLDSPLKSQLSNATRRINTEAQPERLREVGRLVTNIGSMLAIGAMAHLAWFMRGSASEILRLIRWIRICAVASLVGVTLERVGRIVGDDFSWEAARSAATWTGTISDQPVSLVLATVGALAMTTISGKAGLYPILTATSLSPDRSNRRPVSFGDPVAVGGPARSPRLPRPIQAAVLDRPDVWAFHPRGSIAPAVGAVFLLVSLAAQSNALDRGPLPTFLAAGHLVAIAAWLGGTVSMLLVLTHRLVNGSPVRLQTLLANGGQLTIAGLFGTIATGAALSMSDELLINDRLLDGKIAAVATAVMLWLLGRAIVAPKAQSGRPWVIATGRTIVTFEVALLLAAMVATAAATV